MHAIETSCFLLTHASLFISIETFGDQSWLWPSIVAIITPSYERLQASLDDVNGKPIVRPSRIAQPFRYAQKAKFCTRGLSYCGKSLFNITHAIPFVEPIGMVKPIDIVYFAARTVAQQQLPPPRCV